MQCEKLSSHEEPTSIQDLKTDVFALIWKSKSPTRSLESTLMKWVDWRMRGNVYKLLNSDDSFSANQLYLFPTFGRIACDYVAVGKVTSWEDSLLWKNAIGMQWKKMFLLLSDGDVTTEVEKFAKQYKANFPEQLYLDFVS